MQQKKPKILCQHQYTMQTKYCTTCKNVIEESKTLRKATPNVTPNPGRRGSATTFASKGESASEKLSKGNGNNLLKKQDLTAESLQLNAIIIQAKKAKNSKATRMWNGSWRFKIATPLPQNYQDVHYICFGWNI